jgi:outer membrane protein assembly factor BamB
MVFKVSGTTVIDSSRQATNLSGVSIAGADQGSAFTSKVNTLSAGGALLQTLNNPNAYSTSSSDWFGYSVAISGNYAVVGAYNEDDTGGTSSGKAYIFNVTTGALLWTLNNPNVYSTSASDYFGKNAAISGSYAIISAYNEGDASGGFSGKAYIFNVTTGALLWTLNNPNVYSTSYSDYFGWSVAISGNYAIVGAYQEDDAGGTDSGKAYIFNVTTGTLLWTLNNPNPYSTSDSDAFGQSVAISGNYAIVGAYNEDDIGGTSSGKAYIFNVATGQLVWALSNPNAYSTSSSDWFGYSVAISGNYAIVGANNEDDIGGTSSGKAYIFNVATGQLVWTLNNPNPYSTSDSDAFGQSVAISGNYAIVGAYNEDDSNYMTSGKSYIFNVTTGQLLWTLSDPNVYSTSEFDSFGYSVAISGNYAVAGAWKESDVTGSLSGKAYIFSVNPNNEIVGVDSINFSNETTLSQSNPVFNPIVDNYRLTQIWKNPSAYSTGTNDIFGTAVAISGNYAIVGAYGEDDAGGTESGKAYIYNVTTGALVWTLSNPNPYSTSLNDFFGITVDISGNYAIVGAYNEDDAGGTASGKAYIYNVTTGALVWTLSNPNPYSTSLNDKFGYSVAISGNYAIVSAVGEADAGGAVSGKAYIYNVTTGALVWTLSNPNPYSTSANDWFGQAVAISGNYAIVGTSWEDDAGGTMSGKAYIYNVTTGALVWTLSNPNPYSTSANDYFGYSVAISGNYAIVGALGEGDVSGAWSGKAYIFNVTTGQLLWTLNNPNAYGTSADDNFGEVVSITTKYAIVGAAYEDDSRSASSGIVYIFGVETGQFICAINNPNIHGGAGDQFGRRVGISGNYALAGYGTESDASGAGSGAVYLFNFSDDKTYLDKLLTLAKS